MRRVLQHPQFVPRGDASLNRIALGTVQLGLPYGIANRVGQVSISSAHDMLRVAENMGIDTVDTAIAYGDSESCLGQVGVKQFRVITKLPAIPDGKCDIPAWIEQQIVASLDRLGIPSLYGLLLHRPAQLLEANGATIFQALVDLKKLGRVKKIGVSIYSPAELDALAKMFHFDLVQAPLNLMDRRLFTSGWLRRLKTEGVEVHTRSTFLQGLLLMQRSELPSQFLAWKNLWEVWNCWLQSNPGVPAVQACLAYPLSFPEVDRVVVGADSASQLVQLTNAAMACELCNLPDLRCDDEGLINPSNWAKK